MSRATVVLGTASNVGKSLMTAALCRIYADAGVDVAPFKAQNMSNNAGVTMDGGEMGRAQILQAAAARVLPTTDMNPVLLKPNTETGSQLVLHGKVMGDVEARQWWSRMGELRHEAYAALDRLMQQHALVIAEGAGSCAEVNLRPRDYVNFDVAHHADGPVILVADIDRGGVFGQVVGTLECAPPKDRARVKGILVNRFRGDVSLFDDGVRWLEQRTGIPVLGVVPMVRGLRLDEEDAVPLDALKDPTRSPNPATVRVGVIGLPHISNAPDVLPLMSRGEVTLHWLRHPRTLNDYDLLILPGSKNTRDDLRWIEATGWRAHILAFSGKILGLCGGFQILGETVSDPHGVEGSPGDTPGLGLLRMHTVLHADKTLRLSEGTLDGHAVHGYEIHMGRSDSAETPLLTLEGHPDGARSHDNRVWGTYLHGLLDRDAALRHILNWARPDVSIAPGPDLDILRETELDRLADAVREVTDQGQLDEIVLGPPS